MSRIIYVKIRRGADDNFPGLEIDFVSSIRPLLYVDEKRLFKCARLTTPFLIHRAR